MKHCFVNAGKYTTIQPSRDTKVLIASHCVADVVSSCNSKSIIGMIVDEAKVASLLTFLVHQLPRQSSHVSLLQQTAL